MVARTAATAALILTMAPRRCFADYAARPNVAVFGSGALGLLYGGRLQEGGGANVHFLCRRDYDRLQSSGFKIISKDGDYSYRDSGSKSSVFHNCASSVRKSTGEIDFLILALKSYSLSSVAPVIRELVTPKRTRVIALMNGYGLESDIREWIGDDTSIFGAMAFVCANRQSTYAVDEPVTINHLAYGALNIGHFGNCATELADVKRLWSCCKIADDVKVVSSLQAERWKKLCWNIPYNGLSVANGGITTEVICKNPHLREYADRIMQQVIEVANLDLASADSEERIDGAEMRSRMWHLTDNMGPYRTSAAIDLVAGREIEMKYLFTNVLERVRYFEKQERRDFSYLVSVLLQVHAMGDMAALYRRSDRNWSPVDPDFSSSPGM